MAIAKNVLDQAYNLKLEGNSWQHIEDTLGIKVRTLRDNLKNEGYDIVNLPSKPKGEGCRHISQSEIDKAIDLKNEGLTLNEVSKRVGHPVHKLRLYKIHLIKPEVDRINQYFINIDYFNNIDSEKKAYYLGLLAADGSVDNARLRLELQEQDSYIIKSFRDQISPNKPLYINTRSDRPTCKTTECLTLDSKYFVERLSIYGIVPRKSYQATFLPQLSEEMMPHFIRGYFDGDGSVYYGSNTTLRIKFIGNSGLITDLVNYLNLDSKLHVRKEEYTLYFTVARKTEVERLFNYMYSNATIYLSRKKNIFDKFYMLKDMGLI